MPAAASPSVPSEEERNALLLASKGKRGMRSKGTPAALRKRTDKFAAKAIQSRGSAVTAKTDESTWKVSPWVIGFIFFLLVGSMIAGVMNTQKLVN